MIMDKDIGDSGRYCKGCKIPLATVENELCEECDNEN